MEAAGRFQRSPALALDGNTSSFAPSTLPGHRMLRVHLRNEGEELVELRSADLDLLDAQAVSLRASVAFGVAGGATTGRASVSPDEVLTLDFAWRKRDGVGAPARLCVQGTTVDLLPVHALHDVGERDRLA